jgi:hypothetical protein
MAPRLLAPLRDFTEEEARAILNELWKGYEWEEIVARCSKARAEKLARARENGSALDPPEALSHRDHGRERPELVPSPRVRSGNGADAPFAPEDPTIR